MIISRIFQGLGNQFFQYAFARAMALRNGTRLKVDTSFYENSVITQFGYTYQRHLELSRYNVELVEATPQEIGVFKGKKVPSLLQRVEFKLFPARRPQVIKEDLSVFSPELNKLRGNLFLDGYFTSEAFFKDHSDTIRKEFTLKNPMNAENQQWATHMQGCTSVCISLRLTDFLHNPLHNVCSLNYYYNGLKEIEKLVGPDMTVFIWSDDNDWTREHFKPPYTCHYMTHNYPDFHEDLRLMTHCKHHVIPNSTFSWWAAWLGEHEGQVVVAPERWLNSTEIEYGHVIPERWHKIGN